MPCDKHPHAFRYEGLGLSVRLSLQKIFRWNISSECKGSKRIHDQVDPQHLDGPQWAVGDGHCRDDGQDHSDNVDC